MKIVRRDGRGCIAQQELVEFARLSDHTIEKYETNRHALYTCHRYTQCHLSSGQECTKHMCDTTAC